jgi:hypothetical protein
MICHKPDKSFMKAEMDPAKSQGFLLKTPGFVLSLFGTGISGFLDS